MDTVTLREYLGKVLRLEKDIYTMSETITKLKASKKAPAQKRSLPCPQKEYIAEPNPDDYKSSMINKKSGLGAAAGMFLLGPIGLAAGYAIGQASSKKDSANSYEAAMEEYRQNVAENETRYRTALEKYHRDVAEEDRRFSLEENQITIYNGRIDNQITSVEKLLNTTRSVLDALYAVDIIYFKYRHLIAISRFCEYMDSGKRTELGGVNGMYDLYDSEVATNQIVSGLHAVNENLEQMKQQFGYLSYQLNAIAQNQGLLYKEISQCNATVDELCCEMRGIAERQESHYAQMEESARLANYHAEVSARNSQTLAEIAQYEHWQKNRERSSFCI